MYTYVLLSAFCSRVYTRMHTFSHYTSSVLVVLLLDEGPRDTRLELFVEIELDVIDGAQGCARSDYPPYARALH